MLVDLPSVMEASTSGDDPDEEEEEEEHECELCGSSYGKENMIFCKNAGKHG